MLFCFFVLTSSCKSNSKEIIVNSDNLKVIQIASACPLSGDLEVGGISIKNGSQLAIENKEETFKKLGYSLEFIPFDDKADIETGIDIANQIVKNKNILAVVGHYNSGVTMETSKIYNKYNLVMISPASTGVEITARGYDNINRIVAKDDDQGSVAAKFSINELEIKKAFLINDGTEYGIGITNEFKKSYEKFGGKVTNNETITTGQTNFDSEFDKLKKSKSEVLYFGGMYPEAINILNQINKDKIDVKFIGSDGIDTPEIINSVGNAAKEFIILQQPEI
jgi:branched-chain amino acid transport system substrate-binding protein